MIHVIDDEGQMFGPTTIDDLMDILQSLPAGVYEIQLTVVGQNSFPASEGWKRKRHFRFRV